MVLVLLVVVVGIFFRSYNIQIMINECIKEGRYSEALLLASKVGDWKKIIECIEELDRNFTSSDIDEVMQGLDIMIKMGYDKRVKNILLFRAREREDREVLLRWFWWRV